MSEAQAIYCSHNSLFPYRELPKDLSNITVEIDDERPWLATVTEALDTKAPAQAQPYCCYVNTVIFYEKPYRDVGGRFAEYGRIETVLEGNDVLNIEGELFELMGGTVSWQNSQWVMTRNARRIRSNDQHP